MTKGTQLIVMFKEKSKINVPLRLSQNVSLCHMLSSKKLVEMKSPWLHEVLSYCAHSTSMNVYAVKITILNIANCISNISNCM